ncbi:hypothetical protein D3C75_773890 [compost metagenome]
MVIPPRDNHRFFHILVRQHRFLDLTRLDAVAANFHLMIDPTEVFNIPIRKPASKIACSIHSPILFKWAIDELLCRQVIAVQITSGQPVTGNTQLTGYANRLYPIVPIDDV